MDLCNHLIGRAVEVGASDVQVECDSTGTLVRYRIGGVLERVLTLPVNVSQPICDRFKIMARVGIDGAPQAPGRNVPSYRGRPPDRRPSFDPADAWMAKSW